MPFTVSHVAAILPLHKPLRRLGLLSAAAIGAMAPDLDPDATNPPAARAEHTAAWLC